MNNTLLLLKNGIFCRFFLGIIVFCPLTAYPNQAYNSLNPSKFQEPQQTYVRLIKQNPPKNSTNTKLIFFRKHHTNTKFMDNEEEIKEDE